MSGPVIIFLSSMLKVLFWVAALLVVFAAAYLWLWALLRLLPSRRRSPTAHRVPPHFLVVIPAYNEATRLPALLDSLAALRYPPFHYDIWVVADNCTDATAEIAEQAGARVLRRDDPEHRGKGWALQFAFPHVLKTNADAVVVLDADSVVDQNLLAEFANALSGAPAQTALQASSRLRPEVSAQSLLLVAENVLEDTLFYGSKGRRGYPVLLRGGGMCLTTALLRAHPWNATSATEDVEYAVSLLTTGIAPRFVESARVTSASPRRRDQFMVQRTRWGAGHQRIARRYGLRLFWQGIRSRNLALCDTAVGLFVTSKTLLLAASGALTLLAWLFAKTTMVGYFWLSASACAALLLYCLLGLALCRPSLWQLFRALVALPALFLLRVWMHLRGMFRRTPLSWQRTPE